MNTRREFLRNFTIAATTALLPDAASSAMRQPITYAQTTHFDLTAAKQFMAGDFWCIDDEWGIGDLTRFSSYSIDALIYVKGYLATHDFPFSVNDFDVGFQQITPEAARILATWSTCPDLRFGNLQDLDCSTAREFSFEQGNSFSLCLRKELTPEVAQILVNQCREMCSLLFGLPGLSDATAKALAQNDSSSLIIYLPTITVSAAEQLAWHRGYHLTIQTDTVPTNQILQALSSNPSKNVEVRGPRQNYYQPVGFIHIDSDYESWQAERKAKRIALYESWKAEQNRITQHL